MIDGPPEKVLFPVDLHEHLVQMPAPATGFHTFDPAFTDLGSKYRPEPMPPISDGFMADINAPFMEQIFHITKGQRKPDIQHHGQADNLTARFEVTEGRAFCHRARLRNRPAQLKRVSSDSARLALRNNLFFWNTELAHVDGDVLQRLWREYHRFFVSLDGQVGVGR